MPFARRVLHRCMLKQDHLPPVYTIQHHQLATPSPDLPVLLLRPLILILNVTHWHYAISWNELKKGVHIAILRAVCSDERGG
jgi:hypothetical protein